VVAVATRSAKDWRCAASFGLLSGVPSLLLVAASDRELCEIAGARPVCCGIGPVEATLATARALAETDIAAVLHVGIAGATSLETGTVVIGSQSIYCDVLDPNATLPRVARLTPAAWLLTAMRRALPDAIVSPIATAARVGGGDGHPVEAMEGFGVLRAAAGAGVPAIEIRVISNDPADTDRSLWRIDDAVAVLHQTIKTAVPVVIESSAAATHITAGSRSTSHEVPS